MVALCPWWRMLAGGVSGGGEACSCKLLCFRTFGIADIVFSGEILVCLAYTDVVPSLGGPSLPEGLRGYPPYASLCVGGNPRASALVRAAAGASFLKLLLGTRRFSARRVVVLLRRAQRFQVTIV